MQTSIGIGFSNNSNVAEAAKDAAFRAKSNLKQDTIDLSLIFSSIHYPPEITLPIFIQVLNNSKFIGCSTAGVILPHSIETRGIGVLSITSGEMSFGTSFIDNISKQNATNAGANLANDCIQKFGQHTRGTFLFLMDGHLGNTSELLTGLQNVLGNVFPIIGAGSSDDFQFDTSYQYSHEGIFQDSAVGLILGGHVSVGVGARHGWKPLGKPRIIDKVRGNIIETIDGQRASRLYEEYFGDAAQDLSSERFGQMTILYPLGIRVEGGREYLLKNAVDILADGSIVCQGAVPVGSEVHIMIGNKDFCQQAVSEAATEAQEKLLGKQPRLIIVLESMARLKLLGRMAKQEIQRIRDVFGPTVPIFGMYSNGEICPFQTQERFDKPHLLNESIVILAIS